MGLSASDELAFERDMRAHAQQHAVTAEARAALAEERLDAMQASVDELHADIAYWTNRAKSHEHRGDFWFSMAIGGTIVIVGAVFAALVVAAWRATG